MHDMRPVASVVTVDVGLLLCVAVAVDDREVVCVMVREEVPDTVRVVDAVALSVVLTDVLGVVEPLELAVELAVKDAVVLKLDVAVEVCVVDGEVMSQFRTLPAENSMLRRLIPVAMAWQFSATCTKPSIAQDILAFGTSKRSISLTLWITLSHFMLRIAQNDIWPVRKQSKLSVIPQDADNLLRVDALW